MKKHLFTVVLAFVLMATLFALSAAAVDTQAVRIETGASAGVDLSELCEGDTFDVYITVPLTQGANANQLYYRGYDLGSATANRTFNASNAKLSDETFTLSWTNSDMYVSAVEHVAARSSYATATSLDEAGEVSGNTLYYVFPASTPAASAGAPTITGEGNTEATALTISYGAAMNGYMINLTKVAPKPAAPAKGVIAKVTFTVAKESGAAETITLTNSHKINGTAESYNAPEQTVTLKAGCLHPAENRNYEHAQALANNKTATCYAAGETWFYCSNCAKLVKEDVPKTAHVFTNYSVDEPATCWDYGTARWYCANDGCTEYDHTQGTDGAVTLDKLTHEASEERTDTATCTEDGYAFYACVKCGGLTADGKIFYNISYQAATNTFIHNKTAAAYAAPESFKSYALGHDYVQDGGNPNKYVCSRCDAEMIVDTSSRVRYVSQDGGGDGKTVNTPTTLRAAFDELGLLPKAVDATIYLVGDKIALTETVAVSPNCKDCFEEPQHANHITITSADRSNKTTLEFTPAAKFYHLYGPTTFEYINIGATIVGTSSGGGIAILGRGFPLVMGQGLEMLSQGAPISVSKEYLDNVYLSVPDVKVYVAGGFLDNQIYPGADSKSVQTDVTIMSGTYWCIEGLNRGSAKTFEGAHGKLTISGGKTHYLIPTTTSGSAVFNGDDNVVDIHYIPGGTYICPLDYRVTNQAMTGKIKVNRFFHSGASMQVGDFMMGSDKITGNTRIVNCYWDASMAEERHVLHFLKKGNDNAATYAETNHSGAMPAYCIDNFGAHDYVNDVCTRCGVRKCKEHDYFAESETQATCISEGFISWRCEKCYEYNDEPLPIDPDAHDYHFDISNPDLYKCVCSYCGDVFCTVNPKTAMKNNSLYVSDKGVPYGGFTPTLPLNDYDMALQIAAASGETDVTIYIVGTISLGTNTAYSAGAGYLEPEHSGTHVTVCGYDANPKDDTVVLGTIYFDYEGGRRSVYGLNGDVTFDAVEFSSGEEKGNIYIVGRHNHLVFGDHMTSDYLRSANGGDYHGGSLVVTGGCYDNVFGACTAKDTHVEIHSGVYRAIYGGSVSQACGLNSAGSSVQLDLLGNITAREIIVFGSRNAVPKEGDAGKLETISVTIDGDVLAGAHIVFGSYDNKPVAGNVSIAYRSGYFSAYAFGSTLDASADSLKTYSNRMFGSSTTDNDFNNQVDRIDFYYNSSDKQVASVMKSLTARFKGLAAANKPAGGLEFYNVSMDCIDGNSHIPGGVIDVKAPTCAEAGYTTFRCETCGETYTLVAEKLEHNWKKNGTAIAWETVSAANCISPEIQKSCCLDCGYAKYKTVGKLAADAHDFADGICTRCGYDKTVNCAHVFGEEIREGNACGSRIVQVCTICGCKQVVEGSEEGSHNYGKFTVTTEPTATTPGLKTRVCKDCGKVDTAILYATDGALTSEGVAVDANGKTTDIDTAKLSKTQKSVVNAFLSQTAIGTEVKYAFKVNANGTATFSIPLPEKYADLKNVKVIVKDDDGKMTEVNFTVDRGYIVFTY